MKRYCTKPNYPISYHNYYGTTIHIRNNHNVECFSIKLPRIKLLTKGSSMQPVSATPRLDDTRRAYTCTNVYTQCKHTYTHCVTAVDYNIIIVIALTIVGSSNISTTEPEPDKSNSSGVFGRCIVVVTHSSTISSRVFCMETPSDRHSSD